MANEAVLFTKIGQPINFTVSNNTGIEKGAVLQLNDPFTAIAPTSDNAIVAGIAAAEKIANDGHTKLAVFRSGIFKMTLSGSATAGDPVGTINATNKVGSNATTLNFSGSQILGIALESGTNGETILVDLKPECK